MERVIVDRFEGSFAVVEVGLGLMRNVPRAQLPTTTHEGDVLVFDGRIYRRDPGATGERANRLRGRVHRLFGN
ncbi:MAG: DUF3006 domain-containing protein [Atopobiaceae bacterium]|uniref:DUF3006 domain-containing protein n=1 Tax=Olsenella absiana TaxID=3115222 RepID=A0ABU7RAB1_9ACTN|nr:DUF3006 domain-containing protein [Olsenella sp.]MDD7365586.1 DUF3006 domain-containing protein [Olsenella sp.]MDY3900766.1 DUF3006 domain-containing protein [Atopobiaceae bacterium]